MLTTSRPTIDFTHPAEPASARRRCHRWIAPAVAALGLLCQNSAIAQASLAAEDIIESVVVKVKGVDQVFTVIRDANREEQWYYVPDQPRLVEKRVDDHDEPVFQLLKYQFKDPKDPQKELEGGILQFAATLDIPPDAIKDLQKHISTKWKGPKGASKIDAEQIRLAPLVLKSAEVALYAPKDGVLIPSDSLGSGNAPVIASQKMIFSIPLTQIGADVYDALVTKGNGGVPVVCTLKYGGLTPRAGFNVTYNWDQLYTYFSKDDVKSLKVDCGGLFDYSDRKQQQDLYEGLSKSKALTVDVIGGEGFKIEDLDKYLQPILNRIQAEILVDMKPPEKIPDPAKATEPSTSGAFGGYGHSVSIKDIKNRKHGTETVSFNVRMYQERMTIASGLIGIGSYPQAIQSKLVTVVPAGEWDKAFFILPTAFDDRSLLIKAVDIELALYDGEREFNGGAFKWLPDQGWKDVRGAARTAAFFPLMGVKARLGDAGYKKLQFKYRMQVTQGRDLAKIERTMPVFASERPIGALADDFATVGIDPQGLSWNKIDPASDLVAVAVKVSSGSYQVTDTFRTQTVEGKLGAPEPRSWLIPRTAEGTRLPTTVEIEFVRNSGDRIMWKHNKEDLSTAVPDPRNIMLLDADWKR